MNVMLKGIYIILFLFLSLCSSAQENSYTDSIIANRNNYVKEHEVVKGSDKKFMNFFPVDANYRVITRVQLIEEAPWFSMETSSEKKKPYRAFAILYFSLNGKELKLHVYQSKDLMKIEKYANNLFIPFVDNTCGEESYDNGRYVDLNINDLESGNYLLDFNTSYNPYCAYVSNKYSCPVPPKENHLSIAIKAGEMKFGNH